MIYVSNFFWLLLIVVVLFRIIFKLHIISKGNLAHTDLEDFIPHDIIYSYSRPSESDMSACLLIKDENNNLPEWIAYHYHVAQLRNLVICMDPTSVSSPLEIINRWNGTNKMGMSIDLWTNDSYISSKLKGIPPTNASYENLQHRKGIRQQNCYLNCLKHHRKNGRKWTMFIDADEYLTFNNIADDDRKDIFNKVENKKNDRISSPKFGFLSNSSRVRMIIRGFSIEFTKSDKVCLKARTRLPLELGYKTIGEFLTNESSYFPWSKSNCVVLPRLHFGNTEEIDQDIFNRSIPQNVSFDLKKFSTLRFFRRDLKEIYMNFNRNVPKFGKSIVDVSRVFGAVYLKSIHTIIDQDLCKGKSATYAQFDTALLRVNHYSMSRESFFAKDDFRRSEEMYKERSQIKVGTSYEMQSWLISFVKKVGINRAKYLLQGVGEISKDWKRK